MPPPQAIAYGPLFFRAPGQLTPVPFAPIAPPIRVPLLPERIPEELPIPMQFQITPVCSTPVSPLQPPSLLAFPMPAMSPPLALGQSPRFFAPAAQQPGEQTEGVEQQTFRTDHRISAPAFDGRLYSVY
jgi:hypothetical protein